MNREEAHAYRRAAARLSGCRVRDHVSVNRSADGDGAFVECIVWVPREEMEKERIGNTLVGLGQAVAEVIVEVQE